MVRRTLASFLLLLGLLQKGLTALVETQQEVTAALGEDARLTCRLTQTKDVVQVTWQKLHPMENLFLASWVKNSGKKVVSEFKNKVGLKEAELQRSSIVLKNLTEEDEGCYRCVFDADPEGALTGRTCLHLYELHAPVLSAAGSDSTGVSCWATGRPAPSLTLTVLQEGLHLQPNAITTSVTNSNGTVTVNQTAVLSGHRGNGTQVSCTAQVLSGSKTTTETLSFPQFYEERERESWNGGLIAVLVLTVVVTCAAVLVCCLCRRNPNLHKAEDWRTSTGELHSITPSSAQGSHSL